jgi:hypothetical protein
VKLVVICALAVCSAGAQGCSGANDGRSITPSAPPSTATQTRTTVASAIPVTAPAWQSTDSLTTTERLHVSALARLLVDDGPGSLLAALKADTSSRAAGNPTSTVCVGLHAAAVRNRRSSATGSEDGPAPGRFRGEDDGFWSAYASVAEWCSNARTFGTEEIISREDDLESAIEDLRVKMGLQ